MAPPLAVRHPGRPDPLRRHAAQVLQGVDRGEPPRPDRGDREEGDGGGGHRRDHGRERGGGPSSPGSRSVQDAAAPRGNRHARPDGLRSAEQPVHVRPVRRRDREPVRARGLRRGGQRARKQLQPPLRLRGRRSGEDAPAARHRKRGAGEVPAPQGLLHPRREVHQRPDRFPALRKDVRLQGAIPQRRPAADGRRTVHRGEAKHPGGVLPHLQRAVLLPPAGRGVQRQVSQGDPGPRGADPVALRVGPRRRHPGARYRDAGGDPEQEGGSGKHRPAGGRGFVPCDHREKQHPRARRVSHPYRGPRLPDPQGDQPRPGENDSRPPSRQRGEGGFPRPDTESGRGPFRREGVRTAIRPEAQGDRDAAPGGDVPDARDDALLFSRHREAIRGAGSHHGDVRRKKN